MKKARALKAWDSITQYFEENKANRRYRYPQGQGRLSVWYWYSSISCLAHKLISRKSWTLISIFGQVITANIIKINKKRGNVIISRRNICQTNVQMSVARYLMYLLKARSSMVWSKYYQLRRICWYWWCWWIASYYWYDMGRIGHPSEIIKIAIPLPLRCFHLIRSWENFLGLKTVGQQSLGSSRIRIPTKCQGQGIISRSPIMGCLLKLPKALKTCSYFWNSWTDRINDL